MNASDEYTHTLLEMHELGLIKLPIDVLELILLQVFDIDPLYILHLSEVCKAFHRAMQKPTIAAKLKKLRKRLKKDLAMVKQRGSNLQYVKYQIREICMAAVTQWAPVLHIVKDQTREICLAAVTKYGRALKLVKNQTEELCIAVVTQNGNALKFVQNITPEICLAAIAQKPTTMYLQHVN
tara:strand:- start:50837 stop:51379 length:543 start_codon:yes stop_codon:yes gene_type:complete